MVLVLEMSRAPQVFYFRHVLLISCLSLLVRLFHKLLLGSFFQSYAGYDCDVFFKQVDVFMLDLNQIQSDFYAI